MRTPFFIGRICFCWSESEKKAYGGVAVIFEM